MTLDTRFIIDHPINAKEVFEFTRAMIGATEDHVWRHETKPGKVMPEYWTNPSYRNQIGQGLPALLKVSYGADGPLMETEYDEDEIGTKPHDPPGFVEVSMDTAYGYRREGLGCGQLHARYVQTLGRWCEQNGWPYHWKNEFTGEWHTDWRLAAEELVEGGNRANEWFENIVMPRIIAQGPTH